MDNNSIIRVVKNKNYTVIDNTGILDTRLSWKAKGILAYALSRPNDWQFYLSEIQEHSTDGLSSTRTGIAELMKYGYITRKRKHDEKGRFLGYDYTIFEIGTNEVVEETNKKHSNSPSCDFPITDKPITDKPITENCTLLNTDLNQILNKPNTDNTKYSSSEYEDEQVRFKKRFYSTYQSICRQISVNSYYDHDLDILYDIHQNELTQEIITKACTIAWDNFSNGKIKTISIKYIITTLNNILIRSDKKNNSDALTWGKILESGNIQGVK